MARVCAWLLLARLRSIAHMIVRTFLLIIGVKYLLGVGFCSCVFCFIFYLVRTKLVLLIFSAFFAVKKCTLLLLPYATVACLFCLLVLLGLRGYI